MYLLVFSFFRYFFFFSFFSFALISCGSSDDLIGKWESDREECRLKEGDDNFKNSFEDNKYILGFIDDTQIQLTYPQLNIEVNVVEGEQSQGKNKLKCDITFIGTYFYGGLSGDMEINFKNESGQYNSKNGENCNATLNIAAQMPKTSPFLDKISVSLEEVNTEELQLSFPDHPQCKNDKLLVIFKRK